MLRAGGEEFLVPMGGNSGAPRIEDRAEVAVALAGLRVETLIYCDAVGDAEKCEAAPDAADGPTGAGAAAGASPP